MKLRTDSVLLCVVRNLNYAFSALLIYQEELLPHTEKQLNRM